MSTPNHQLGRAAARAAARGRSQTAGGNLWCRPALAASTGSALTAGVLVIVGYAIVANETVYDDQESGIILALAGLVLSGLAAAGFLLLGRRALTHRRVAVLGAVPASAGRARITAAASSTALVGGQGLTRYHRSDCALALGRDWPAVTGSEHEAAGRTPCGVCRP